MVYLYFTFYIGPIYFWIRKLDQLINGDISIIPSFVLLMCDPMIIHESWAKFVWSHSQIVFPESHMPHSVVKTQVR